ncbi:MAG: alpha-L-fucosidase [Candidatus Eisenbacteria bacterium]|uniref:alpha-L-fucosidase n=1 Tax=Eiseniibacteriota bacterium TaxID=2212470 RepID=A0A948W4W3_UNCEI|nr:alpha-L-fucosidase [Candidatus Eisenbacteria bacterium]MBU1951038.1 alpha-L-fucosidase [Candidatus Eisenbacteria bacterium]MBU2689769.1 alpha-L-fucosidase [Candidatus Eisenbacteria bacterium]
MIPGHAANHSRLLAFLVALVLLLGAASQAPGDATTIKETDPMVLEKLEWFQNQKFGLLMHWGPYCQWQIVESWSLCPEDENWCERRGEYAGDYCQYKAAYDNLKTTFNPIKFDPDLWAEAASAAGMRYVVFTTKHHDGFCMFDTKETNYKVTADDCAFSSNPRANITREIFSAFRKRGFGIGAYFSKADWHCPDYWWPKFPPFDRNVNYDIKKYPKKWESFKEFTYNQIKELMSDYGGVDILWLDGGWVQPMTPTSPREGKNPCDQNIDMPKIAAMARSKQPGLIIVDRAVEGNYQNYRTPEQEIPDTALDHVWETCMTMATAWTYVATDTYKPTSQLIHYLVEIVAKGGNLLLNIGPSAEGEFAPAALDRLEGIAAWMKVNSNAIYSTRAVPPYKEGKICFTRMPDRSINAIYLADEDELQPPEKITINAFIPEAGSTVTMYGVKAPVAWERAAVGFTIRVPEAAHINPPCRYAWAFHFSVE